MDRDKKCAFYSKRTCEGCAAFIPFKIERKGYNPELVYCARIARMMIETEKDKRLLILLDKVDMKEFERYLRDKYEPK